MKTTFQIFIILLLSLYVSPIYSQVCISLNNWTLESTNGDGTCNYTLNVTIDSANGAQGDAVFSIAGTNVFTVLNCVCNPQVINVPVTVACNSTIDLSVSYDAPGNGNDCSGSTGDITLPVEWGDFKVYAQKDVNKLEWVTLTEINNEYFSIEHSVNGIDWVELYRLESKGNSSSKTYYAYEDKIRKASIYSYYRIKQIDYDGGYSFSPIKFVKNLGEKNEIIIPNPVGNRIDLENQGVIKWYLLNSSGSILANGCQESIDLSNRSTGVYILTVLTATGKSSHQIMKF